MLKQLSLDEFLTLAKTGKKVIVFQEFASDLMTPITAFQALTLQGDGSILLESGVTDPQVGHYSHIGINALKQFSSKNEPSLEPLRNFVQSIQYANEDLPMLSGGLIGYVSYDAVRLFEKIPDRHEDIDHLPDFFFQLYEVMITFDHFKETVSFSIIVEVGSDPKADYENAISKLQSLKRQATQPSFQPKKLKKNSEIEVDIDDESFCEMVNRAKEYIVKGDAFQIVLSRTFKRPFNGSALDIYRALRLTTPAPFMFFLETKDYAIAGASPERLISLKNGVLETNPIAGSRPRGDLAQDLLFEEELLKSEKEAAEHMMLVDLGRNDLGKIASFGSVQVKELKRVRRFSTVMHLVSTVQGSLNSKFDALDALQAAFPAGTLTGAPKVRAMQIIDELENSRRGLYGGAICHIDCRGNLESCIAIRTVFLKDNVARVRVGAGVVFDSDPKQEANETRHKAKGVLDALRMAEEGIL